METEVLDVPTADSPGSTPAGGADSSSAVEPSAQPQAGVTGAEGQQAQAGQDDPLEGLPDVETLKQQAEQKTPYADGLLRLRTAYEAHKAETEPLMAWKDVASRFADPSEVVSQRELVSKIHSPVVDPTGNTVPGAFTSTPFLQDLETQSPGTVSQLTFDGLGFVVEDENGRKDTLARHWFRSIGLDPDRVDDYKAIDSRAPAGVVTPDQLAGIDPKYHEAFKALSPAQREDILYQRQTDGQYPATVMDYLQDKAEAMDARKWREQDSQRQQAERQAQQQEFERATTQAVNEDISGVRREMYDSIHKTLAAQWKPSTDEKVSQAEYRKVMGALASLLIPEIRWTAEEALKEAGTPLDPKFDELVNAFAGSREAYIRFTRSGDQMRARLALSEANLAKAQLNTKLNEYALALADPTANRLQTASQTTASNLSAATARVVPTGTVQPTNGSGNPYEANPYQLGTPEYREFNRKIDREYGLTNAAGLTA